jgi:hypothetical protein
MQSSDAETSVRHSSSPPRRERRYPSKPTQPSAGPGLMRYRAAASVSRGSSASVVSKRRFRKLTRSAPSPISALHRNPRVALGRRCSGRDSPRTIHSSPGPRNLCGAVLPGPPKNSVEDRESKPGSDDLGSCNRLQSSSNSHGLARWAFRFKDMAEYAPTLPLLIHTQIEPEQLKVGVRCGEE